MKRGISAVLLGLAVLLAACSQSAGGGAAPSSSKPVSLRFGIWNPNQAPAMEQIAAKFKETHPHITVNIEITPFEQYFQKLETAAAGNSMPDVFWMNPANFLKFASNDQLLPLTDKIGSEKIDLASFPQSLLDLFTYKDQLYAFPKDFDTIGLWYNKEMFDQARIPYPDESWDWNKALDAAKKLTDPAKGVFGITANVDSPQTTFYNLILQNGGYVMADDKMSMGYDKPEAIEAMQFWHDLIHVHKVSPTIAQMTDTKPLALFQSGKTAMFLGGSWEAIEFNKNEFTKNRVDVAPMPKIKKPATVINGLGYVAAKSGKNPNEAWQFLKFLGSKEAAEIQAATGAVIPAYNGTQEAWVKAFPQFKLKVFIDATAYSVKYPVSIETLKIRQSDVELLTKALSGQMTVEQAMKQMAEKDKAILEAEKK